MDEESAILADKIAAQWMEKLKREGFKDLAVCSNGPDTDFGEHTHEERTVHVVLNGELTLTPGRESVGQGGEHEGVTILREGDRFEIPAGTTHKAKCGPLGCTFIVGVEDRQVV